MNVKDKEKKIIFKKKNVSTEENPHPSHKKRLGERLLACIVA